jgi:outer membrane protein assembly factor BamB
VLRTGEIGNATLRTATSAVAAPPSAATSTTLTPAWHSTDATAEGAPFDGGTVVTYDQHTVTGRNYATGAAVWSYNRSDATVCKVYQETGQTMAIYTDPDGFCDEISAFKTGTGKRVWYRTLDSNGNTISTGNPAVFSASEFTVLITTPNYIQAVDPVSNYDRWTFVQPSGCQTTSAVMGSGGVLIGQHCTDGDHLVLRDAFTGDDDNDKNKTTKWRLASNAVPVSADGLISALDPSTGELHVYNQDDGKVLHTQTLTPAPNVRAASTAAVFTSGELVTVGNHAYALDIASGAQLWSAALTGRPTVQADNPLALTTAGIVELAAASGDAVATYAIPSPPAGSTVVRLATGFVVAGPTTTVYR